MRINPSNKESKYKVLIVEDNEFFIEFYTRALVTEKDVEIEVARNGLQALLTMHGFAPHFLILDLQIPIYSGIQLMKILDAHEVGTPEHIFIITGIPWHDMLLTPHPKASYVSKECLTLQRLQLLVNDQINLYKIRETLAKELCAPNTNP